jgi:hypothetical protein
MPSPEQGPNNISFNPVSVSPEALAPFMGATRPAPESVPISPDEQPPIDAQVPQPDAPFEQPTPEDPVAPEPAEPNPWVTDPLDVDDNDDPFATAPTVPVTPVTPPAPAAPVGRENKRPSEMTPKENAINALARVSGMYGMMIDQEATTLGKKPVESSTKYEYARQVTEILISDEIQADPKDVPLSKEVADLLHAQLLEHPFALSKDDINKIKNVAESSDWARVASLDEKLKDDQKFEDVINFLDESNARLTDEERDWLTRVLKAPSLTVPKQPTTRDKLKQDMTHKTKKRRILPEPKKRHVSPTAAAKEAAKPKPRPQDELSPEEMIRLKKEFFDDHAGARQSQEARMKNPSADYILTIAKREAVSRLERDQEVRLKEHAKQVKHARVANYLGLLGVRDEQQQPVFEYADASVKAYNERLRRSGGRLGQVVLHQLGVQPIDLVSEELSRRNRRR